MAKTFDTPLYYDESRNVHTQIPSGQYVDPAFIAISDAEGNIIKSTDDGLYAEGADVTVVSSDGGNMISAGTDGGALLTKTAIDALMQVYLLQNAPKIVSDNDNNLIRVGTDNAAHMTADDVLSNGDINLLTVNAVDHKVILTSDTVLSNVSFVSDVAGNLLGKDENGRIYLLADDVIASDDPLLYVTDGGKIASDMSLAYDADTGEFKVVNHDGEVISSVTVTPSVSMLINVEVVKDPAGYPEGTYLAFTFELATGEQKTLYVDVSSLIDVYTAGSGLELDGNEFSVALASSGYITVNKNGKLTLDIDKISEAISENMADWALSSDSGNDLALGSDGKLYVEAYAAGTALRLDGHTFHVRVSGADGNKLSVKDGALYAAGLDSASEIISQDAENFIVLGSDALAFSPCDYGTM